MHDIKCSWHSLTDTKCGCWSRMKIFPWFENIDSIKFTFSFVEQSNSLPGILFSSITLIFFYLFFFSSCTFVECETHCSNILIHFTLWFFYIRWYLLIALDNLPTISQALCYLAKVYNSESSWWEIKEIEYFNIFFQGTIILPCQTYSDNMAKLWGHHRDNFTPEFWFSVHNDVHSEVKVNVDLYSRLDAFGQGWWRSEISEWTLIDALW